MDGRFATVMLTLVLPAVLVGVTIYRFSSNPIAILVLFGVMVAGGLYLLTYQESFA
jgi:hypothetical protein